MAMSLTRLAAMKAENQPFVVCTAYDSTFAYEISKAGIEVILVGDSLGMVLQGRESTVPVSLDEMAYHTECVSRGNDGALIMADLPFMTYGDVGRAADSAMRLMQAGAHVVKVEGGEWLAPIIENLARQGVPVCAHLGLTPQSVNKFGGYKVQGREDAAARQMLEDAAILEGAGADLLLLECVPNPLASRLTQQAGVPVIGIGAGPDTDGQVLVLHDLLGIGRGKRPRFVRNFMEEAGSIPEALSRYASAVREKTFPGPENSFES